jgi:VIT1/CCC1 family predicted Fe2+/Mn2+ transporter
MKNKKQTEIFMRNFIFGVEDSLVSTVGLLSGIAVAGITKTDIFLTGIVLIFVEAFSMGVGSFLSEDTTEDLITKKIAQKISILGAVIMFVSYFVAGMVPLSPYLLFEIKDAFIYSNVFSLIALFLLGAVSAMKYKRSPLKLGIKMFVMGGIAIVVGILIGRLVQNITIL